MSDRAQLTDGRWFSLTAATVVAKEATWWNGSNRISKATGSPWVHESILLTARGTYVLHQWSQWQGGAETYAAITPAAAASWILRCGEGDLPEELAAFASEAEA